MFVFAAKFGPVPDKGDCTQNASRESIDTVVLAQLVGRTSNDHLGKERNRY